MVRPCPAQSIRRRRPSWLRDHEDAPMPAILNEPENQGARRFVLRPIQPTGLEDGPSQSVTRQGSGEHHQEWEFADPWADDEGSPAALVVTRRVGDVVVLLKI